ncbi:hypothetical protein [Streptomyces sp. NBC_01483]|uniref:hypothetical protein n=1 Tax=Streptomyces sp. NBC_01483 TaxID=2903883 RepID=UPI002E34842B|nr:hypothetical protein [Streptomyces sp. NBC_01483]
MTGVRSAGLATEGPPAAARPRLVERWREAADRDLTPTKRSLVVMWASFGTTWGAMRLITHGIRGGWLPSGNISADGEHLHHYNFGIATLAGIGLIAVRGDERAVGHPAVAAAYGAGTALITDEFALLLDLQDVYERVKLAPTGSDPLQLPHPVPSQKPCIVPTRLRIVGAALWPTQENSRTTPAHQTDDLHCTHQHEFPSRPAHQPT